MAPPDMRGLTQYIADIRACRVRELEEKRINKEMAHIRAQFKRGDLDGYQKKKYLAKILFTYILGYPVDLGHVEAVNLISSPKYSEKQIGYLALTLLLHENSPLLNLIVNSIRKDLLDHSVPSNCLALHAIANIGGKEIAESLTPDVYSLLISPTSEDFVKKKAALTLLRLYRKYPTVVPVSEWGLRIVSILDDSSLSVCLCAANLVLGLCSSGGMTDGELLKIVFQKAVERLNALVVRGEGREDYVYYKVLDPWLQVALLRLIRTVPVLQDPTIRLTLHNVLQTILTSTATPRNVQHNNALNAILFEAINLAIHLDPSSPLVTTATQLLSKFVVSKETNIRYLGLDTMAHLAARAGRESLEVVKRHMDTVFLALRDRDVSVRRRGLDLLYSMCDLSNSRVIVSELLRYLPSADISLREEMVLKIAILAEKFATEYNWYVDTILKLMNSSGGAGDYVGDEVWYRVVQIVVNTEELQEYSVKRCMEELRTQSDCHENVVKISAYLLGEYGHLIANEKGFAPIEQFQALHSKSNLCSNATKGILLTTYLKWLNLFPEISEQLLAVFRRYSESLDAELQQRACEALAIAGHAQAESLLAALCDEMPPFAERESAILHRLLKKHGDIAPSDKSRWITDSGAAAGERKRGLSLAVNGSANGTTSQAPVPVPQSHATAPPQLEQQQQPSPPPVPPHPNRATTSDIMNDLMTLEGLSMSDSAAPMGITPSASNAALEPEKSLLGDDIVTSPSTVAPSLPILTPAPPPPVPAAPSIMLTHGADKWLTRLQYSSEGILWEDGQIQIGMKTEFHGHMGRLAIYFGNKIDRSLESFTSTIDKSQMEDPEALEITIPKIVANTIGPITQIQQLVHVECKDIFKKPPILKVSYLAGSLQVLNLQLPLFLSKFIEPVAKLPAADFFERWKQIGGPPRESQSIFPIKLKGDTEIDVERNKKIVSGLRMGLLDGIDPNPINIVAAGVLHMSTNGKVGCLVRYEPNKDAKLARLTIRTTNENVSQQLMELFKGPMTATQIPKLS
ncbi:Adaptor protein complex AP-2 alpha subunit [Atractiella rhizophila]|nr:Adaptor protein complex AP-2 alpha subunit [Atractiella rhizophila]